MPQPFGNQTVPVGPTSGGKIYGFNNINNTIPTVVAPINTNRNSISFHNPGSVGMWIFPVLVQAYNSIPANINEITNQPLIPTTSAVGGGFYIFGNGGQITLTGECGGSFQALSQSGSGNALTVIESNT